MPAQPIVRMHCERPEQKAQWLGHGQSQQHEWAGCSLSSLRKHYKGQALGLTGLYLLCPLLDARGERDNALYSATFTPGLIFQQLLN